MLNPGVTTLEPDDPARSGPVPHQVLFQKEVAALLRVSLATLERRRHEGSFPIHELPSIDNRPRWSRKAVEQYLASTKNSQVARRRARPRQ
jgi:hypothetical protein